MNKVMDLTDNEVLTILKDLKSKGKNRADIMLEFFEISDITSYYLPADAREKEQQLKKTLMSGASQGWI